MAQLIPLADPIFATERGSQDPRLIHAWVLSESVPGIPTVYALVSDPIGNIELVGHSELATTVHYDFKHETWFDQYEAVQAELAKADKR